MTEETAEPQAQESALNFSYDESYPYPWDIFAAGYDPLLRDERKAWKNLYAPFSKQAERAFSKHLLKSNRPVNIFEKGKGRDSVYDQLSSVGDLISGHFTKRNTANQEIFLLCFWNSYFHTIRHITGIDIFEIAKKPFSEAAPLLCEAEEKFPHWSRAFFEAIHFAYLVHKDEEFFAPETYKRMIVREILLDFKVVDSAHPKIFSLDPLSPEEKELALKLGIEQQRFFSVYSYTTSLKEEIPGARNYMRSFFHFFLEVPNDQIKGLEEISRELINKVAQEGLSGLPSDSSESEAQEELSSEEPVSEAEPAQAPKSKKTLETSQQSKSALKKRFEAAKAFLRTAPSKYEVKRPIPPLEEEGKVYTGYILVANQYINFYPKFVWVHGFPEALDNERVRELFPDYGSFLIDKGRSSSRKYSNILTTGALVNVRLRKDPDVNYYQTGAKGTRGVVHLSELLKKDDIWSASEGPEQYRAYYIVSPVESAEDGSPVFSFRHEPSQCASDELKSGSFMVQNGEFYIGPQSFAHTEPKKFKVIRAAQGADAGLSHMFKPLQADAVQSFAQWLLTVNSFAFYDVFFTSPRLSKEYVADLDSEKDLLAMLADSASAKAAFGENAEKIYESILDLRGPQTEDPAEQNLYKRRKELLLSYFFSAQENSEKISEFAQVAARLLNTAFAENPVLASGIIKKISEDPQSLRAIVEHTEFNSESLLKEKEAIEAEIVAQKKAVENNQAELDAQRTELEAWKQKNQWAQSFDELKEEVEKLRADRLNLSDEVERIRKQKESEEKDFLSFEERLEKYRKSLTDSRAKVAELYLNDEIRKMAGLSRPVHGPGSAAEAGSAKSASSDRPDRELEVIADISTSDLKGAELINALCDSINAARGYGRNDIVNLLACLASGFLTVFAGAPGSGKTSLSDILGEAFGLNTFQKNESVKEVWGERAELANRYLAVAVERGWTSKRDFIGYYNPLNDSFECGDPQRYEFLRILDDEARREDTRLPYFLLLDEANLSPMEYYYADFMNFGERSGLDNFIALGDKHRYKIGGNLRVIATINTDHTTERLSPRLLDRSWIVTLPESREVPALFGSRRAHSPNRPINWNYFLKCFAVSPAQLENAKFDEAKNTVLRIAGELSKLKVRISRRSMQAALEYTAAGMHFMEGSDTMAEALDYAVSQRFLPQIDIFGDCQEGLEKLDSVLTDARLYRSSRIVQNILEKGADLKGFSFF